MTRTPNIRRDLIAGSSAVTLVFLCFYFYFCLVFNGGDLIPRQNVEAGAFWRAIVPTWEVAAVVSAFYLSQIVLYLLLPGEWIRANETPGGDGLEYKINGLACVRRHVS